MPNRYTQATTDFLERCQLDEADLSDLLERHEISAALFGDLIEHAYIKHRDLEAWGTKKEAERALEALLKEHADPDGRSR